MKQNVFKVITCCVFLIGGMKYATVSITCPPHMNVKRGTLFVDPECVRCFGRIDKIEGDKAVLLLYKTIHKAQFLLYTKKCSKAEGHTPGLPIAVLFAKESDIFSLKFLTRNEQEYYETFFKPDAKPQPQKYVWSEPQEHITNPELREKCWEEQIRSLGYSHILFHSLWSANKRPLDFRLSPQTPWIGGQNLQIQLFSNIIDAFAKEKIDKSRICNYWNGKFHIPDEIDLSSEHKYCFNTPNGIFLLELTIDLNTKKHGIFPLDLTVDPNTKQINATLKALVIATIAQGSFRSDTEGNLFTDPICKEVFGKFKILRSGRALLMCNRAIQETMFLYTGSRFALLNLGRDSKLTLKFLTFLTAAEAEKYPKAKLFIRTLGLPEPILKNVTDFVLGLQD